MLLAIFFLPWSVAEATPLFEEHSVLDVELKGPIYSLIEAGEKPEEVPFVLRENGLDYQVTVRLRGKSRLRVCDFPPLRVRFDTEQINAGVFAGQDKVKLVTHCRNNDKGEKNALEEYTAYRLFALLTEVSFRVRLMRITYTDTDQKLSENAHLRYGFAIEPMQQLAQRVGGEPLDVAGLSVSRLNRDQASLVFVFQYLIGNTDWSFVLAENDDACCHNGDLLDINQSIYFVPYDFDLAGIVNAKYAKPDSTLRLKSVRQRRYRGYCTDTESVETALRHVKSMETSILDTINSIPGFTENDRASMREYLGEFFKKAQNEDKLLREFEKRCLGK